MQMNCQVRHMMASLSHRSKQTPRGPKQGRGCALKTTAYVSKTGQGALVGKEPHGKKSLGLDDKEDPAWKR